MSLLLVLFYYKRLRVQFGHLRYFIRVIVKEQFYITLKIVNWQKFALACISQQTKVKLLE